MGRAHRARKQAASTTIFANDLIIVWSVHSSASGQVQPKLVRHTMVVALCTQTDGDDETHELIGHAAGVAATASSAVLAHDQRARLLLSLV